jgi:hypothetical protein
MFVCSICRGHYYGIGRNSDPAGVAMYPFNSPMCCERCYVGIVVPEHFRLNEGRRFMKAFWWRQVRRGYAAIASYVPEDHSGHPGF